jgi:hypothetical protein
MHSQTGGLQFNLSANGMHITLKLPWTSEKGQNGPALPPGPCAAGYARPALQLTCPRSRIDRGIVYRGRLDTPDGA